jgi:hypothetical protein
VIPEQYVERKRDFRPNNFLGASFVSQSQQSILQSKLGRQSQLQGPKGEASLHEEEDLEIELTEEEFHYAVEMTEASIRRLTKAHIIDLRNIVKPHHLVEKVLNMVCILRGCIAPNWTMARELLSSMTFKLELVLLDASKIKQSLVRKVIKILSMH